MLTLEKYTTYFKVPVIFKLNKENDFLDPESIYVVNNGFSVPITRFLYENLTEFEKTTKLPKIRYYLLDAKEKIDESYYEGYIRLPIMVFKKFLYFINQFKIRFDVKENECNPFIIDNSVKIKEGYEPRDIIQQQAIEFLTNRTFPIKFLEIQTGKGKTFCATYSVAKLGLFPCLICVKPSLMKQWKERILEYLEISQENIYIIKGINSLLKLYEYPDPKIKFIIASNRTLYNYITDPNHIKGLLPKLDVIWKKLMIGCKIIDEAHLEFRTNVYIDLYSNICYNIYLTATGYRSDKDSNKIFFRIFPSFIRFRHPITEKYLKIIEVHYKLPIIDESIFIINEIGYNHVKYENYLTRRPSLLENFVRYVMYKVITEYFLNVRSSYNEKCIIFIGRKEFGTALKNILIRYFPNLRIDTYYSGDDHLKLQNNDIIITTLQMCGTGTDLPTLRTLITFVSFSSKVLTYQVPGRLRNIGGDLYFIYLVNDEMQTHLTHASKKRSIFRHIAASLDIVYL